MMLNSITPLGSNFVDPLLNVNQFHQECVSRSRSLFSTDITNHVFSADPVHAEPLCNNLVSDVVISTHDMTCVLRVLI